MSDARDAIPDDAADDAAEAVSEAPARAGGDFLKTYVVVMAVVALVLGFFDWTKDKTKSAYAKANAEAQALFGGPNLSSSEDDRPTTIRSVAIGIQKYLQTIQGAPGGQGGTGTSAIPIKLIKDTAEVLGLTMQITGQEQVTKNVTRRYEEVSTQVTLGPTDLDRLSTFIFNLESKSTTLRVLDLRWQLKAERENPVQPGSSFGNMIEAPVLRIGFRRPLTN